MSRERSSFEEIDEDMFSDDQSDSKPLCQFGSKCYRKNPQHLKEYQHVEKPRNPELIKLKEPRKRQIQKGKITDFFTKRDSTKKGKAEKVYLTKETNNYQIESSSEEEILPRPVNSKHEPNGKKIRKTNEKVEIKLEASTSKTNQSDEYGLKKSETGETKLTIRKAAKTIINNHQSVRELVKEFYLFDMPEDFYLLWEFCKEILPQNPEKALECLDLELVGPYDILAGKLTDKYLVEKEKVLCHWRYFYDLPEFQTVIKGDEVTGYHIGYFRDDPNELPVVVSNSCLSDKKAREILAMGDNIFCAIFSELNRKKKSFGIKFNQFQNLEKNLIEFCKTNNLSFTEEARTMTRKRKVVAKTLNKFGIVVPVSNDVGYRELNMTNSYLKDLLHKLCNVAEEKRETSTQFQELQHLISCVNFANDECDFGMGYELGVDLFCFGDSYLHSRVKFLLSTAYNLLGRPIFCEIIEAHLKYRKKPYFKLDLI